MKQDNRQTQLILCLFGILPVAWLGLSHSPGCIGRIAGDHHSVSGSDE